MFSKTLEQLFRWAERLSQQETLLAQLPRYTFFINWLYEHSTLMRNRTHIQKYSVNRLKINSFERIRKIFFRINYIWNASASRCWRHRLWFLFYFHHIQNKNLLTQRPTCLMDWIFSWNHTPRGYVVIKWLVVSVPHQTIVCVYLDISQNARKTDENDDKKLVWMKSGKQKW